MIHPHSKLLFGSWLLALLSIAHCFSSCVEIGPAIDLTGETTTDTTYVATQIETPQEKNVLLEEFTGVRCVNCPQGHELLDNLENQHGERFLAVSNHSEFLAEPYDGDQDLRVADAQAFEDLLGPIAAKPSASVDRKLFSGETSLVYFTQKWANYVNQQLSQTTPVNIHIEAEFDNAARNLDVIITLHYTAEELQDNKLTVLLLEDSILTSQIGQGSVIDTAYVQNRVLRKSLTSTNGVALNVPKEAGRVIVKSFTVEHLPALWNADKLRIVALVHRSGSAMDVLQAVQHDVN